MLEYEWGAVRRRMRTGGGSGLVCTPVDIPAGNEKGREGDISQVLRAKNNVFFYKEQNVYITWNEVDTDGYQDQNGSDALSKYLLYAFQVLVYSLGGVGILEILSVRVLFFSDLLTYRPSERMSCILTVRQDNALRKGSRCGLVKR